MKKVLSLFLVIILLGFLAYWLGLPNLKVAADEIGIIHTKTSGYELISSDHRLRWDYRKLLPNNYQVYTFSRSYQTFPISVQTHLVDSDLLKAILPLDTLAGRDPFSFELGGEISFKIKEELIIPLLESGELQVDQLDAFYQQQLLLIHSFLSQQFASPSVANLQYLNQSRLLSLLQDQFPNLQIQHLAATNFSLPDAQLYTLAQETIKEQSDLAIQGQAEIQRDYIALQQVSNQEITTYKTELAKLEAMGQLLTRYPILIAYLALQSGLPADSPLIMPFLSPSLKQTDTPSINPETQMPDSSSLEPQAPSNE